MTVKEVSSAIYANQRVHVWNCAQRKMLFEGIKKDIPEDISNLKIQFIASDIHHDVDKSVYYDVITIYVICPNYGRE